MSDKAKHAETQPIRTNMVEGQLRTNRISEPGLLQAFLDLPREVFVPRKLAGLAYVDGPLPLEGGRVMLEPYTQARLLVEAALTPQSLVLVIGAGTGYLAALASRTAKNVIALEEDAGLFQALAANVQTLNLGTIQPVKGTLADGCFAQGPFDAIIIEGGVAEIPAMLVEQLAEKGRLVAILVEPKKTGRGVVVERAGKFASTTVRFDAEAPYLPGFAPITKFEFA